MKNCFFLHVSQRSVYGDVASRRVLCTIHIVVFSTYFDLKGW